MSANSLTAKTSFAWIMKNATPIVNIIGIIVRRYKSPIMNAMEHASSAKMVSPKDRELPITKGSGKERESS